jgi:hypothetical protein
VKGERGKAARDVAKAVFGIYSWILVYMVMLTISMSVYYSGFISAASGILGVGFFLGPIVGLVVITRTTVPATP